MQMTHLKMYFLGHARFLSPNGRMFYQRSALESKCTHEWKETDARRRFRKLDAGWQSKTQSKKKKDLEMKYTFSNFTWLFLITSNLSHWKEKYFNRFVFFAICSGEQRCSGWSRQAEEEQSGGSKTSILPNAEGNFWTPPTVMQLSIIKISIQMYQL